jgi:hypothetical protein
MSPEQLCMKFCVFTNRVPFFFFSQNKYPFTLLKKIPQNYSTLYHRVKTGEMNLLTSVSIF